MGDPRDQPEAHRHNPWDIDVEMAVLGTMLRHNAQIDVACADIVSEFFYDPLHARLFDMLVALRADGDAITPLILHSTVKSDPGVIETGGQAYFDALFASAPAIPNMRDWARILADLALRRDLRKIADVLKAAATSPPSEITGRQAADQATEALLNVGRASAKPILSVREVAMQAIKEIEDARAGIPIPQVPSGIKVLDKKIGGFRGSDLIIIPAKSAMGKTSLMGAIALNTARAGYPTLFFSLEMSAQQLAQRMVCALDFETAPSPMYYSSVRNHRLTDGQIARYITAADKTDGIPLEIVDEPGLTMQQIFARARAFKAKHGNKLGIVFGDYMQKVGAENPQESRERQVNNNAGAAKNMAKYLGWPVVFGSQMNEDDKARGSTDRRPQPGDVRESRGIQHEADLMLSPWWPAYWQRMAKPADSRPGDPAYEKWSDELAAIIHHFELLGIKYRHGNTFDVECYVEMGSAAIMDEEPTSIARGRRDPDPTPEEQAAHDLLANV